MTRTDKELLEMAAKAAGYPLEWNGSIKIEEEHGPRFWNPLDNDTDALRLAIRLRLIVTFADGGGGEHVCSGQRLGPFSTEPLLIVHCDMAATRRAIVRAAAEIGKEIK